MHLRGSRPLELPDRQQFALPLRRELHPGIVHGTKEFEYTHSGPCLGEALGFFCALSYQEGFAYPERTLLSVVY